MKNERTNDIFGITAVIASGILLGLFFAILFAMGLAPLINTIFIYTFVVSLVFVILLVWMLSIRISKRCYCAYGRIALFAALLLLVLSILSLATCVTPACISFSILVFFGAAALFIAVISLFALIYCLCNCNDTKRCD